MAEDAAEAAKDHAEPPPKRAAGDAALPPVDDGSAERTEPWTAAYSSAVRLAAGLVGVVADRAREPGNPTPPGDPDSAPTAGDISSQGDVPGMVLFGLAADLPNRLGRVTSSVVEKTGLVRGIVGYGWRVTANSPVGWLIARPVEAVQQRVDAENHRLSEIGRTEVAHGKALVGSVVDATIDEVLDNVSESDALNELIREQAFGITDSAIQEVRETGAAADNLTDLAIRKILRREPRSLPPKPANGR